MAMQNNVNNEGTVDCPDIADGTIYWAKNGPWPYAIEMQETLNSSGLHQIEKLICSLNTK
jgi:hypothetical protein